MFENLGPYEASAVAVGAGALARVAFSIIKAGRDSKETDEILGVEERYHISPDEDVSFPVRKSEPVVTSNRLADSDVYKTSPQINAKSEWMNQYTQRLRQIESQGFMKEPATPEPMLLSEQSSCQFRLLPPRTNKPVFAKTSLNNSKHAYFYNVVDSNGENKIMALPESLHRQLVAFIQKNDIEPTDAHDGYEIRVQRTTVGNVPWFEFEFYGPKKLSDDPISAAEMTNRQFPLERALPELDQMIVGAKAVALREGDHRLDDEPAWHAPKALDKSNSRLPLYDTGSYVEVVDKTKALTISPDEVETRLGLFEMEKCLIPWSGLVAGLKNTKKRPVDRDYGKVIAVMNGFDQYYVVEVEDDGGELRSNKKSYFLLPTGSLKQIQKPSRKIGDYVHWTTRAGKKSPGVSPVLDRCWNGENWIYTLHWFQNGNNECVFNVPDYKILHEGEKDMIDKYKRQYQQFKQAEIVRNQKAPLHRTESHLDMFAQIDNAGRRDMSDDLMATMYGGKVVR